ncbi:chromo domain-containing protein [Aphelenchoides avenae]|nr:chromo domain-containing protein [Aphelenchus avenae]
MDVPTASTSVAFEAELEEENTRERIPEEKAEDRASKESEESRLEEPRPISGSDKEGSSESEELFEVERVVGHKRELGKLLYKIRWVGFDEGSDTWEPASNMLGDKAKSMVEKYWQEQAVASLDPEEQEAAPAEDDRGSTPKKEQSHTPEGSVSGKPKRTRKSNYFYEYKDEEAEDASWFGIDPEVAQSKQVHRELRNLYVADRVPSWTEKVELLGEAKK